MNKGNSKLLTLGSAALSTALILGAFGAVWLMPREAANVAAQTGTGEGAKTSQVTVRGTGSISAKPDTLVVNIGVNIQDSTVKAAQDKASAAIAGMEARQKAAGVAEKDFRTSQYNVEPVMDYGTPDTTGAQPAPKLTGFRVINMLEITFRNPATAPAVMDELVAEGANTVYTVGYSFGDPDALAKQAYDKAVADANDRAGRLAGLSNLKLGRVLSVTEGSANVPGLVFYDKAQYAGGGAGTVYPGQQSVSVDVIVTYEATEAK